MKSIKEAGDLRGKRVLVRIDWSDGDTFRIQASKPTLNYLSESDAQIILATHIDPNAGNLNQYVPAGALLLPNLRANPGEEANSEEFAKELADQADLYVNEAFSVSHREHASIVSVPKLIPSFAGLRFIEEVENLSKVFNPSHPFLLILGGAKFETKLPLVEKFLNIADEIFILGANALPASTMSMALNPKIHLPVGDPAALDANTDTLLNCKLQIANSKLILWNGPLGKYEDGLKAGTLSLAQMIADSGKESIVGGGDTLAALNELNIFDKFSFVSTGGGAMLAFLAKGTLPGIEALK